MYERVRWVGWLITLAVLSAGGFASAAPGDEDEKPKGPAFRNAQIGLSAESPSGWKLRADEGGKSEWTRLATFWDPGTTAEVVLSQRKRTHSGLAGLLKSVRKDWDATPEISVTNTRTVEGTALNPKPSIIVDGNYVMRPKAKDPTQPPPAPVTWRVSATYFLAPGNEYLLYAKSQATHWSRVRTPIKELAQSVKWDQVEQKGPKGAGAYRNEKHGFACTYPESYTVVIPARTKHIVQFESVAAEDPVIGVYRFGWDEALDRDVQRLVTYYEEELGGEAEVSGIQVSGQTGQLITANANVGGREQTIYLAIVKRGASDFFRLKASMPRDATGAGKAVFQTFVQGFKLGPTPR